MPLLTLEHSPGAYRADFVFYGALSLGLLLWLLLRSPAGRGLELLSWAAAGGAGWTLVEYLLHRFVLHGLAPFNRWHAEHHRRPTALIASPTLLSATLFATLAALPVWLWLGAWPACALVFGLVSGYLAYGLTHHATHHALPFTLPFIGTRGAWLSRRKRWHALHHATLIGALHPSGHFGVISGFWDQVFGTLGKSS